MPGFNLVSYLAPDSTPDEEVEATRFLDAVEPPRRQDDLLGFVSFNPTPENIERAGRILRASKYKIGDQDAVKLFWKDDPARPHPSIKVQRTGRKN